MTDIYLKVGKQIRFYRKLNHLTQDQLGELTDIDQSYLGRIERGEVNITLETLNKLALALHINPEQLLYTSSEKMQQEQITMRIKSLLLPLQEAELQQIYVILQEILHYKKI